MFEKFTLIAVVLFLIGCATISGIENKYLEISLADGITEKEAQTIAQKYVIDKNQQKNYIMFNPQVQKREKFPNSWVVHFKGKKTLFFRFENDFGLIVVVEQTDGNIALAERHSDNMLLNILGKELP